MIVLVPKWAHHYEEFWNAIRIRNLWFIKIRYIFVGALLLFVLAGEWLLNLKFSTRQILVFLLITLYIFSYNLIIQSVRKRIKCVPGKFNPLHLSLLQIVLDLSILLVLIYYTGGIDSHFHIFAIFHTIIGSLILPGHVIFTVMSIYLLSYAGMCFLQYFDILHVHYLIGLFEKEYNHGLNYVLLTLIIYSTMILMSVYLANKISHQLYRREQQLKTSLEKIQQVEEKKQKYIIGVVHEIKSPISAIQSIADLILQEYIVPLPAQLKEKIERIKIRSADGLNLVNNVLFISRLRLLNLRPTESIDVMNILNGVIDKRCTDIRNKNINLKVNDLRNSKRLLSADKILFELAISNLLCNAFKYTPTDGKVLIELRDDENNLFFEISDTGIGIPKNEIQNIMHEFYRATNVKRTDTEGSGLGLALVKEVIELHKGEINFKSPSNIGDDTNPGTTVILKLPFESESQDSTEEMNSTKEI
ncbi:MAG: HAMP domain-containing histidine kinase [Melioribacteraceae bacterium]|nr:HAMP domain-containing histidine kinase [Melioribacteraceae bacterium]